MDTLVRLQADELTESLVDFIKSSFKGKRIAVHIYEDEIDETEYLMQDVRHKAELLEAVENVKKSGLTTYTFDEVKNILNEP